MTTKHPVIEFVAGDDWEIRATCLDENGNAYDLSGSPTIMYLLYDDQHSHIIDSPIITIMGDPKLGNISFNELNELLFRAGRHRYSSYTYIFTHSRQELSRLAKAKTED